MRLKMVFDKTELKDMRESTLSRKSSAQLKEKLYVEYCKAYINGLFQIYDSTTAFIQSMFYLDDLMTEQVVTPEQVKELDVYIHLKAL